MGIIIGIIVGLLILLTHLIFAALMERITVQKGYENSHAFALVLFFGIMGCLYVVALPDQREEQQREDILTVLLTTTQGDKE